jgi:hypothetical protein
VQIVIFSHNHGPNIISQSNPWRYSTQKEVKRLKHNEKIWKNTTLSNSSKVNVPLNGKRRSQVYQLLESIKVCVRWNSIYEQCCAKHLVSNKIWINEKTRLFTSWKWN